MMSEARGRLLRTTSFHMVSMVIAIKPVAKSLTVVSLIVVIELVHLTLDGAATLAGFPG